MWFWARGRSWGVFVGCFDMGRQRLGAELLYAGDQGLGINTGQGQGRSCCKGHLRELKGGFGTLLHCRLRFSLNSLRLTQASFSSPSKELSRWDRVLNKARRAALRSASGSVSHLGGGNASSTLRSWAMGCDGVHKMVFIRAACGQMWHLGRLDAGDCLVFSL